LLLSLPPLPYLTPQIYALLSLLLSPPPAATSSTVSSAPTHLSNLTTIIDSLLSSPPSPTQTADQVEYTLALTSGLIKLARQDPLQTKSYLLRAWSTIWTSILINPATKPDAQRQASQSLGPQGLLRYCISDEMVLQAVQYKRQGSLEAGARKKQKTPFLTRIIEQISGALQSHALLMPHLLPILSALIARLRLRVTNDTPGEVDATGTGTTAAEELILDLVCEIGDLRLKRGFEEQEKADAVVGSAIEVMGVEAILKVLPLNVEPDANGVTPFPGRAHLLPLMRSKTTNDHLGFFTSYFVPLSERLFERKLAAEQAEKSGEAKVWEVVIGQVWDCLPGFLDQPRDLKEVRNQAHIRELTDIARLSLRHSSASCPSCCTPILFSVLRFSAPCRCL
jgi:ribosomal RNA-processing protein 12